MLSHDVGDMSRDHGMKSVTSEMGDKPKRSNKRKRKSEQSVQADGDVNDDTGRPQDALRINRAHDEPSEATESDRTKEKRNKKLRRSLQKALEDGGVGGLHVEMDVRNDADHTVEEETPKPKPKKKSRKSLDESSHLDENASVKQEHSSQYVMPTSSSRERSCNDDQEEDGIKASSSAMSTKLGRDSNRISALSVADEPAAAVSPRSLDDDFAASSQLIQEGQSALSVDPLTSNTEGRRLEAAVNGAGLEGAGGSRQEVPTKQKRKSKKSSKVMNERDPPQSKRKRSQNNGRKDDGAPPTLPEIEQDPWDEQFSRHATSPEPTSQSSPTPSSETRHNAASASSAKATQSKRAPKFVLDAGPGDSSDASDSDASTPASTPPSGTSRAVHAVWQQSGLPSAGTGNFKAVSGPSNLPFKNTSSPQKVYSSSKKANAGSSSVNKAAMRGSSSKAPRYDNSSSSDTSSNSDGDEQLSTEKKRKRRLPVEIEENRTPSITSAKKGKRASTGNINSGDTPGGDNSTKKTRRSIKLEEETRLRPSTIVPTYSGGKFMPEEIAAAQNVLELYGDAHDLTQYQVKALLQKGFYEVQELWLMVFEAIPSRDHNSLIRFMRRKFNNFEKRGGGWTPEEDEELRLAYERTPSRWWTIAEEVGRFKEDCRDRYRNYIATGNYHKVREMWTEEEEAKFLEVISECYAKIREVKRRRLEENPRVELPSDYRLLHWKTVSDMMGGLRSRLQCRKKYLQLHAHLESEDEAVGPQREVQPSRKWREATRDYKYMKNGDKYELLCHIRDSHAGKEKNIKWSRLGTPQFRDRWEARLREYAWIHLKHKVPNFETMKLQDIVATLIRSYEEDYPQTLSQRFQNTEKGKKREERNRVKKLSAREISASDEEEHDTSANVESSTIVDGIPESPHGNHISVEGQTGDVYDMGSQSPPQSEKPKSKKRQSLLKAQSGAPREDNGAAEDGQDTVAAAATRKQEKKERRKRKLAERMRRESESLADSVGATASVNTASPELTSQDLISGLKMRLP